VTTTLSEPDLARLLPGSWEVAATNFPFWLAGTRLNPVVSYETITESPLVLRDVVSYETAEGIARTIVGRDRFSGSGFTWRGRGLLGLIASQWRVTGVNESHTVVAIHYERTVATPAGVDILIPVGTKVPEVRTIVATDAAAYGLTLETFASLTWLGATP
jgi:hypothetical protein